MGDRFKNVKLHSSEKADETWINPDHIVAITPDPRNRFMVVVLNVFDASGFSWSAKTYKITVESGHALLSS